MLLMPLVNFWSEKEFQGKIKLVILPPGCPDRSLGDSEEENLCWWQAV